MTTRIVTGGPAFPETNDHCAGANLREFFTAFALAGMMAKPDYWTSHNEAARFAVSVADATLKELGYKATP